jgi:transcriptional regulator with XRE-family HTH domain
MNREFTERLKRAFDYQSMAEIARRLEVPHATIRNYFQGRLPAPEVLIKIADETNVSLNWLLLGQGEMFVSGATADIGRLIEDRIARMIDQKLAGTMTGEPQRFGTIDESPDFDVAEAVENYGDPERVMAEWFRHEGREQPADFGIVFFQGWETYTPAERVEAVRDAKKVLDRTLRTKK